MSIFFTRYKQLWVAIFVMLTAVGTLSACSPQESVEVGAEPSLGTPQTLFRDSSPVVTADLDVLGTVQVQDNEAPEDPEQALEPISDTSGMPLIWFGVVGLGLAAIAITMVAVVREDA